MAFGDGELVSQQQQCQRHQQYSSTYSVRQRDIAPKPQHDVTWVEHAVMALSTSSAVHHVACAVGIDFVMTEVLLLLQHTCDVFFTGELCYSKTGLVPHEQDT